MTTDERISQDLAVVGRVSRERPISLDMTLRKVGALREASPRSEGSPSLLGAVLVCSRICAQRTARAWSGATALICIVALLVIVALPWGDPPYFDPRPAPDSTLLLVLMRVGETFLELLYVGKVWVAAPLLGIVLGAYVVGARAAARRFEPAVAASQEPLAVAHRLARQVDRWAIACMLAGTTAFILFFGMLQVAVGSHGLFRVFETYPEEGARNVNAWTLGFLGAAIVASSVGAAIVARRHGGSSRLMIAIGAFLGFATLIVGLRYDVGPIHVTVFAHQYPSLALRVLLTATGTLGVFLVVAGVVLRRRDREEAELAAISAGG
jgi:hypothetical protein